MKKYLKVSVENELVSEVMYVDSIEDLETYFQNRVDLGSEGVTVYDISDEERILFVDCGMNKMWCEDIVGLWEMDDYEGVDIMYVDLIENL